MRERLTRWALRRQGPDVLPLTLNLRRLYILPTRAGVVFAGLIGASFVAGIQYGSGLALLLTFWLTGFALAAMLRTHRSLAGARIVSVAVPPQFAGRPVTVLLQLQARAQAAELAVSSAGSALQVEGDAAQVPGECTLAVQFPPARRGRWKPPPLQLTSHAPFGLFRVWTWLGPEVRADIYPEPLGERPLPEAPGESAGSSPSASGQDELTWLRPFRDGDSPRQVAWKAYAREMPLLVREYRGQAQQEREFGLDSVPDLPLEAALSQLCAWVLECSTRGERYRLHLPGDIDLAGQGAAHREQCLQQLARFGEAP